MREPSGDPAVAIFFSDRPDGQVEVVLRTRDKIMKPEDRTPAQQAAYDLLQLYAKVVEKSGESVNKYAKRGDMKEYEPMQEE